MLQSEVYAKLAQVQRLEYSEMLAKFVTEGRMTTAESSYLIEIVEELVHQERMTVHSLHDECFKLD
jgi:hypothetical protein